jgi:hypothetical protein
MAFFPKIQSPCPYKSQLASMMEGDSCRICQRQVFDLDGWSDGERRAFLAGCSTDVCVSYRLPAAVAAAAAALAFPAAAAAQDQGAVAQAPALGAAIDYQEPEFVVCIGGIKDPRRAEFLAVADDPAVPELPVVYEEGGSDRREMAAPADRGSASPISD